MQNVIRMEDLSSGYEKNTIFANLNTSIQAGKITTIIGPNGCGKSTLLKTIGRILQQKSGKVYLQEQDMQLLSTKEIAKKIAILSQNPIAPSGLKVEELISYGRYPHRKNVGRLATKDQEVIQWAMDITHTTAFRARDIEQLSGGQRQKVWLAMALAQETSILLLDEPTTYLDMAHQLEVLQIVQALNEEHQCTIVMVLHDINHAARFSHELIAMKDGTIVNQGSPSSILTNEVMRAVFQIDAKIMQDPETGTPICYSYDVIAERKEESNGSNKTRALAL
ncbi:iron complex transport system ATP-binding protein [Paenibacillus anaericanus]|uniref:ABC transporter ATP-binding protein n=1 Tax=Paenibacillus anaericanus TaxID=170367 RepID=UPI00277E53FF|nr:ABC transporter ATP-binding protein [Paenibacillus anaericanus]MDQ0086923.1 iron complex transport system ATP-binding protein [Paenibacillus anaericanus]